MEQKIIQIGNSQGIIIPQEVRTQLGLETGDSVLVEERDDKIIVSPLKKTRRKIKGGVNAKFMRMVDEFAKEHEDVLRELAKR